jgi:hypothetical protein
MGAVPFEGAAGGDDDGTNTAGISVSCEGHESGRPTYPEFDVRRDKMPSEKLLFTHP